MNSHKFRSSTRSVIILVVFVVLSILISGCSGHTLSGKYYDSDCSDALIFNSDGTCKWYHGDTFFEGTYRYDDNKNEYYLELNGNNETPNMLFSAGKVNESDPKSILWVTYTSNHDAETPVHGYKPE